MPVALASREERASLRRPFSSTGWALRFAPAFSNAEDLTAEPELAATSPKGARANIFMDAPPYWLRGRPAEPPAAGRNPKSLPLLA
jgi:hypothetical protein